MNLRGGRRSRLSSEVSTSSLNDIMFMLLLFFLIISTMVNPSVIKLILPRATGEQTVAKKMINVSVDANRNVTIDDVPVTIETLEASLQEKIKTVVDPSVVLKVDQSLSVQDFVDILDIGAKLKVRMVLAVQNKN
ncbi:biopolymer transporter ExbD [Bacteroidota bacterium]|nr:biopolymer transporter ExbD [Bacteroidota bacterium]